jgi:1-acyl-sn-glycerol-3-phosphate acyltransferase
MRRLFRVVKAAIDCIITLILWSYFIFGYCIFYIPVLLVMMPFIRNRGAMFQKINHYFYRGFFILLGLITPGLTIKIGGQIAQLRSAVVVSNHRSYLDPLLMISMFPRHKTIVKGIFFKIPIMRWVMRSGGYIPFVLEGDLKDMMIEGIRGMDEFFKDGGVLFIFPEGKRSRNGALGNFKKGAFGIAEKFAVPVEMLYLDNTDRLFTPGRFFFNTCTKNTITVEWLGSIKPDVDHGIKAKEMRDRAVRVYADKMNKTGAE